jgi:hypothetical protein
MITSLRPALRTAGAVGPSRLAVARRARMVAAGVAMVAAMWSSPLSAQAPDSSASAPRVGCFRGETRPTCASFWLIELQGSTALLAPNYLVQEADYSYRVDESEAQYELTLGHMANLNRDWAVGGAVSLGTGADDAFTGFRGRVRRWVSPDLSLEFEAGLARDRGNYGWYSPTTGFSTGLRFNIQDYGSVFVRYDGYRAVDPDSFFGPYESSFAGSRHFVRGGVGLGSKAAVAGTGLLAVGYVVLLGIVLASGGYS